MAAILSRGDELTFSDLGLYVAYELETIQT